MRFFYIFVLIWAMQATHAATKSFFKMVFLGEDDVTIFVYIKINSFYQVSLLHTLLEIPVTFCQLPYQGEFGARKILDNAHDYFPRYPTIRNAF